MTHTSGLFSASASASSSGPLWSSCRSSASLTVWPTLGGRAPAPPSAAHPPPRGAGEEIARAPAGVPDPDAARPGPGEPLGHPVGPEAFERVKRLLAEGYETAAGNRGRLQDGE